MEFHQVNPQYMQEKTKTTNVRTNTMEVLQSLEMAKFHREEYNRQLPEGWSMHESVTGHPYYFKADTGESKWTRPVLQTIEIKEVPA